jgi:hypothetical protein
MTKHCNNKTRVIIWYTGNNLNIDNNSKFLGFRGNNIVIEQETIKDLTQKATKNDYL